VAIDVRGVRTLMQVFDMPTSLRFYRDLLGFEILDTSYSNAGDQVDWCFLRLGKAELRLASAAENSLERAL
jgi:catechol 2,3-dioxygenase-like lactoylglutathione lyase family enzyme